jgi:DNA-binding winged helix-turn-helix (wHTH) protein
MLDEGWRFGTYELHAGVSRVMRGRRVVPLTDTEVNLLTVLVRNRGEVVSREALFEAVWSSRMADDNALTTNMSRMRSQLGEDVIPTFQHGGYRLGCRIEPCGTEPELVALRLCARLIDAEDRRQRMPDAAWDEAHLPWADDVREALDWALAEAGRKHIAIRLAGASGRLWERLSALSEGRRYLDRAVELIDEDVRPADAARLLRYAGLMCREIDRRRAASLFERAAPLYRELKDKQNLGAVLGLIGDAQLFLGHYDQARAALREAEKLLSISDQSKALWNVFNGLGILAFRQGMPSEAMHYFAQARDLARLLNDALREYIVVLNIGELEFGQGALDRAIERASEAVEGLSGAPPSYRLRPLVNLAIYEALAGNLRRARKAAKEALPLVAAEGGHWLRLCLQAWAFLAAQGGRHVDAARLLGFVDLQCVKIGEARDASEQQLYDRLICKLQAKMTLDSIEVWRGEGAAWSAAQAVKCVHDRLAIAERSRAAKGR